MPFIGDWTANPAGGSDSGAADAGRGQREREGKGRGREGRQSRQSCFCLIPLSSPPEPATEGTLGTSLHSRTRKAKQLWSRGEAGGSHSRWDHTDTEPAHQAYRGGQGPSDRASTHIHVGPLEQGTAAAALAAPSLLHPDSPLPHLPEDWGSGSTLLPATAPSTWTSLGSLWEGRTGRKSCGPDPRPLSCFSAGPGLIGLWDRGGGHCL